ncbi:MAG: hypothetical protein FWG75_10950 [Cystobacterineae bacterium]|nr:hypothetical protein [Cystobacterineae bacterium]
MLSKSTLSSRQGRSVAAMGALPKSTAFFLSGPANVFPIFHATSENSNAFP